MAVVAVVSKMEGIKISKISQGYWKERGMKKKVKN